MEVPDEDCDVAGSADANIVFVLEKATLETAKVGKVCRRRPDAVGARCA